jgi:hypothetical protein
MYIPGGHRFHVDQRNIFKQAQRDNPRESTARLLERALQSYYGEVLKEAEKIGPKRIVALNKGDCGIWHPMLPHGGSPATDPMLTRKSMVFHCAPSTMQVYQHDIFFTADAQPPRRYGFREFRGRQVALVGEPVFQT